MKLRAAADEVIAYGRELWDRRLVSGSSGNLSVRLGERILVTPSRASLRNLRREDLALVDLEGIALCHPALRRGATATSELPLHLAAYRARADVEVVFHTHPTFCVICSMEGKVFERETVGAKETLREVAFAAYAAPGSQELAQRCGDALARNVDIVLMENHGLTVASSSFEDAFIQTDLAEEAARLAYFHALRNA